MILAIMIDTIYASGFYTVNFDFYGNFRTYNSLYVVRSYGSMYVPSFIVIDSVFFKLKYTWVGEPSFKNVRIHSRWR